MTTFTTNNKHGQPIINNSSLDSLSHATPFSFGSGHFRPSHDADLGLVYDANYTDYLHYLCALNMNSIDPSFKCPPRARHPYNLNYPSIVVPKLRGTMRIERMVTNVSGRRKGVYFFYSRAPPSVVVRASPNVLYFDGVRERKMFRIIVSGKVKGKVDASGYAFGWFAWSDRIHNVRSQIAISST